MVWLPLTEELQNDSRLDNIPIILETPDCARDAEEIRMLYSFVEDGEGDQGEDAGGDESKVKGEQ